MERSDNLPRVKGSGWMTLQRQQFRFYVKIRTYFILLPKIGSIRGTRGHEGTSLKWEIPRTPTWGTHWSCWVADSRNCGNLTEIWNVARSIPFRRRIPGWDERAEIPAHQEDGKNRPCFCQFRKWIEDSEYPPKDHFRSQMQRPYLKRASSM